MYHSNEFLNVFINIITTYNVPAKVKMTPPTISCFQDINRTINKINTGILCINNPNIVSQKPNFISKISKENIAKNSIKIIDKILGVQYINLLIFFSIYFDYTLFKRKNNNQFKPMIQFKNTRSLFLLTEYKIGRITHAPAPPFLRKWRGGAGFPALPAGRRSAEHRNNERSRGWPTPPKQPLRLRRLDKAAELHLRQNL